MNGLLWTLAAFVVGLLLLAAAIGVGKWLEARHEAKRWWWT